MVRKGSILPKGCDFLHILFAPAMSLIGEDEVRDYVIAAVLTSPIGCRLEEAVFHFSSQGLIGNTLDDLRNLDAGQLCFLEPGGLLGHPRGGNIDKADEISELHAFVVVLKKVLAGLLLGGDENQEMVIVVVDLM